MYKDANLASGTQDTWQPFEMESLEANRELCRTKPMEFVCLQTDDQTPEDFMPLDGTENAQKQRAAEAEDIIKKARDKGIHLEQEAYEKGFSQGEKDGLELGEQKALKVIEKIENLFMELSRQKQQIVQQHEKEILSIIFSIAVKIIHHHLPADEGSLKETVLEVLNLAVEKRQIIINVNPEDYQYIEQCRPELFNKFKDIKTIRVTSDPSISQGGCIIETPCGDMDASVETRLEKIYQSLEDAFTRKADA